MFSTSQFISIILAPLAIVMLVRLSRATTPEPKRSRKGGVTRHRHRRQRSVASMFCWPPFSPAFTVANSRLIKEGLIHVAGRGTRRTSQ